VKGSNERLNNASITRMNTAVYKRKNGLLLRNEGIQESNHPLAFEEA
jgi:hypothetical protein